MTQDKRKALPKDPNRLEEIVRNMYGEEKFFRIIDMAFRHAYIEAEFLRREGKEFHFATLCAQRREDYLADYYQLGMNYDSPERDVKVPKVSDASLRQVIKKKYGK